MEKSADDGLSLIAEWTIENFSCWNEEIHGNVIECPHTIPLLDSLKLYPRGFRGSKELEVILFILRREYSGKLSFIGADGCVLSTKQIYETEEYDDYAEHVIDYHHPREEEKCGEISSGLKFEEIVAQFKKNEALHEDVLTLRLWIADVTHQCLHCMRTVICVEDISVKISGGIFDQFDSFGKTEVWISNIIASCLLDGKSLGMDLTALVNDCDDSKIDLKWDYKKKQKVLFRTHMSVLNKDDTVVRWEENEHVFHKKEQWTFSNSLTRDELRGEGVSLLVRLKIISRNMRQFQYGYEDHVYVSTTNSLSPQTFCKIIVLKTSENPLAAPSDQLRNSADVLKPAAYNQPGNSVNVLTKELMCLFQDQKFSDLELKCDKVSFPVHRAILSARSPVLDRLLSDVMREAASGKVDIKDLDAPTLGLFLTFLYTGTVEDLECDRALKLYYAADKYQVPSLKIECARLLGDNVSISNVCDILSLADRYRDDKLTAAAHDFILNNYNEVLKSKEWNSFMEREPLLAVKTVTHFAAKDNVGKLNA